MKVITQAKDTVKYRSGLLNATTVRAIIIEITTSVLSRIDDSFFN
jgi:hypothetical protein